MLRCRLFAVALSLVTLRGRAGKGSGLADNVGVGRKKQPGKGMCLLIGVCTFRTTHHNRFLVQATHKAFELA